MNLTIIWLIVIFASLLGVSIIRIYEFDAILDYTFISLYYNILLSIIATGYVASIIIIRECWKEKSWYSITLSHYLFYLFCSNRYREQI